MNIVSTNEEKVLLKYCYKSLMSWKVIRTAEYSMMIMSGVIALFFFTTGKWHNTVNTLNHGPTGLYTH